MFSKFYIAPVDNYAKVRFFREMTKSFVPISLLAFFWPIELNFVSLQSQFTIIIWISN